MSLLFQLGVTHRGARAESALARERAGGRRRPFAFTILEELHADWRAADEPLLARLYGALSAGEGVFKTTTRDRFTELDQRIVSDVAGRFGQVERIVTHDMAASSGVTSLELHRALSAARPAHTIASDRYDHLTLIKARDGWTTVVDADGRALQFVGHGFALSATSRESLWTPVNWLLRHRQLARWRAMNLRPLETARDHAEGRGPGRGEAPPAPSQSGDSSTGVATVKVRHVPLFHPECLAAARHDPHFALARHDLFSPNPTPCHIARVMNFLTPRHLTTDRMRQAVVAAAANLLDGGLLIVGRSVDEHDGHPRATAFERRGNRLTPAWRVAEGCEEEDLIASTPLQGEN